MKNTLTHIWQNTLLRYAFLALAVIYLLCLSVFAVERIWQNKLPGYKVLLEDQLQAVTGLHWELQGLQLRYHRLDPIVSVERIVARSPAELMMSDASDPGLDRPDVANDDLISIQQLEFYLNLTGSVLQAQPEFYGIRAQSVEVNLHHADDGWTLPGLQLKGGASRLDQATLLKALRYLDFPLVSVNLHHDAITQLPDFLIQFYRQGAQRQLVIEHLDSSNDAGLSLKLLTSQTPHHPDFAFTVHADTKKQGLSRWLNGFFVNSETQALASEFIVSKRAGHFLNGALKVGEVDMRLSKSAPMENSGSSVDANERRASIAPFSVLLTQSAFDEYLAVWPDLTLRMADESISVAQGQLLWRDRPGVKDEIALQLPELNLDYLSYTLGSSVTWERILGEKTIDVVRSLYPQGMINQFSLQLPVRQPAQFQMRGYLKDVSVNPYGNAPGGSGITGPFAIAMRSGSVLLDAEHQFSLSFPSVYREPLEFASGKGRVSWSVANGRVLVQGNGLQVSSVVDDARFGVNFYANGRIAGDESSTMTLEVGVQHGEVENLLAYVPYNAPEALRTWLSQAAPSGYVERGGFWYNGSLQSGEDDRRSTHMFFELNRARLQYHSDWPEVTDANGLLVINGGEAKAWLSSARSANIDVSDVEFNLGQSLVGQTITVDTELSGNTGDLLELLKTSPIRQIVGPTIQGWSAEGLFDNGRLQLQMPLAGMTQENVNVDTQIQLIDSLLQMDNPELEFSAINGALGFSTAKNLHATDLTAVLWDKPVKVQLGQRGLGSSVTDIQAQASVDVKNLSAWIDDSILRYFSGKTPVNFNMALGDGYSELAVESALKGVAIDLPAPLYKARGETQPFSLRWLFRDAEQPLFIQLGDSASLLLAFDDFHLSGSVLEFGDGTLTGSSPAVILDDWKKSQVYLDDQLSITGRLDDFNLEPWQAFIASFVKGEAGAKKMSKSTSATPAVRGLNVAIDYARLFGQNLYQSVVSFNSEGDNWLIDIDNAKVSGRVTIPSALFASGSDAGSDAGKSANKVSAANESPAISAVPGGFFPSLPNMDSDQPRLGIDFKHLYLETGPLAGSSDGGAAAFLAPHSMYPLDVEIDEFFWNEKRLGRIRFQLTASDTTALVHGIDAEVMSLKIVSDADDGLLWAKNANGQLTSALNAHVSSAHFDDFLKGVRDNAKATPMVSESMKADLSLFWPAAPHQISLPLLQGDIDFQFAKGRFFQTSQSTTGLLKLVGLINFDTLLRRVQLDFADVYKEGLSFDKIIGKTTFSDNRLLFRETPIEFVGPASNFKLRGEVDMQQNTIDAQLVATLPVANNLPWIGVLAGGLPGVAGAYVVQQVFGDQIKKLSTASYSIKGNLNDPQVTFDKLFDNAGKTSQQKASGSATSVK